MGDTTAGDDRTLIQLNHVVAFTSYLPGYDPPVSCTTSLLLPLRASPFDERGSESGIRFFTTVLFIKMTTLLSSCIVLIK
jgi:hypothetical protein